MYCALVRVKHWLEDGNALTQTGVEDAFEIIENAIRHAQGEL
jgi:hypothetical protein